MNNHEVNRCCELRELRGILRKDLREVIWSRSVSAWKAASTR